MRAEFLPGDLPPLGPETGHQRLRKIRAASLAFAVVLLLLSILAVLSALTGTFLWALFSLAGLWPASSPIDPLAYAVLALAGIWLVLALWFILGIYREIRDVCSGTRYGRDLRGKT